MNNKFLLICSCSGTDRTATIAFNILYPNEEIPKIIRGKEAIAKLGSKYKNEHIKSISKLNGKFSYYVMVNENGKIIEEYDLILGKKIV